MKFLLLLVIVVATLALFNPGPDAFADFARERAQDVVGDEARAAGGALFGSLAGALAGEVAGALADGAVERKNYLVCSVYTLDLNGAQRDGGAWTFLGVGGQFVELDRPAMLED